MLEKYIQYNRRERRAYFDIPGVSISGFGTEDEAIIDLLIRLVETAPSHMESILRVLGLEGETRKTYYTDKTQKLTDCIGRKIDWHDWLARNSECNCGRKAEWILRLGEYIFWMQCNRCGCIGKGFDNPIDAILYFIGHRKG